MIIVTFCLAFMLANNNEKKESLKPRHSDWFSEDPEVDHRSGCRTLPTRNVSSTVSFGAPSSIFCVRFCGFGMIVSQGLRLTYGSATNPPTPQPPNPPTLQPSSQESQAGLQLLRKQPR